MPEASDDHFHLSTNPATFPLPASPILVQLIGVEEKNT